MDVGDKVIATTSLGALFTKVPKGTKGVVTKVSFFGGTITVDFENGAVWLCNRNEIERLHR
jgi:hypothetical protein